MPHKKQRLTIYEMRWHGDIRYDETWREIMKEVAKEMGVPVGDVERINSAWWKFVREMMARVELPTIYMAHFVKLKPSLRQLRRYIGGERGGDKLVERKERLAETEARILAENKNHKGRNNSKNLDPVRTGVRMLINRQKKIMNDTQERNY